MTTSSWNCEYPRHEGERMVRHPYDRFQKRIEYRRADGNVRAHAKTIQNLCRACMEDDWRILNQYDAPDDQGTML